jgi:NAD(P)-dependent dehydrogenase (short-subunit alcohol dehydrogenase family)
MKGFNNGTALQTEQNSLRAGDMVANPNLAAARGRFAGKVVLLAGKQPGDNASLALRFARMGTDVAIVYRADLCEETAVAKQVKDIQAAIEATDQHCLLLPADATTAQSPTQLIRHIVAVMGRLDFFISRPAFAQAKTAASSFLSEARLIKAAMQAILDQE